MRAGKPVDDVNTLLTRAARAFAIGADSLSDLPVELVDLPAALGDVATKEPLGPEYADVVAELKAELKKQRTELNETDEAILRQAYFDPEQLLELAFDPREVFAELARRDIHIHEQLRAA